MDTFLYPNKEKYLAFGCENPIQIIVASDTILNRNVRDINKGKVMLSTEQVQQIVDHIGKQTLTETLISDIRKDFPGIHFTYCMDDDIPEREPVLNQTGFNLYLIDGREHCLCFTDNLEHATGIVIAEVIPD